MKKLYALILFTLSLNFGFAQVQNGVFSTTPTTFTENDEITITVSGLDLTAWSVSDVYLWAWYADSNGNQADSPTNGSWTSSDDTQKMTDNGDGTYSYTMIPSTFYGATGISQIGMLVKAKDGTGDKKTQDFTKEVGGYQLVLTAPTQTTTIVSGGTDFTIEATASANSSFVLTANGSMVDNSVTSATTYSFDYTVNSTTNFELTVANGTETLTENFTLAVSPTVTEEALPDGLLDGINFNESDPTKATLVLYAPGKEFVHVIGDFNDWTIDNAYLMKKDSSQDRFWIELTGLTPNYNHLYQYLVEFDINIADPYATLILDGYGNDAYITDTTYPDLPTYPSGQTEAITVLRTDETDYTWQTTDFTPPAKEDLVVYEILLRDFDALHSFDAVKNRLDYLEELGINAIELMPVSEFDGNESWGYNPSFHMALDKYYGTKEAFKSFIDECHSRGMAVILDVVYNHATGQNPYYRMWNTDNGGTGGQASADNPFFNATATHSYSVFNDFNHQQQATKDYVNRTVTYWIEEFKIDGMRWDLTKGFTQNCTSSDDSCTNSPQADRVEVLKGYADNQWASDEDFYVIFEHLGQIEEEEQWANYRVDEGKGILLWNKMSDPYNEATMGYNESSKSDFSNVSYVSKGFDQPSVVSYMESHDEERLMYKNLLYGNSEGSYDVTDESTALSRMQTAGAFFFTVPGPKMIWQFGELGYDISIEEGGRTGNKPILWEYTNEPDRFAIYETWQDLIALKLKEPIFETSDFSLDVNAATGLKTIHLTDNTATGDEIKYVTIVGNFGVTSQEIVPDFQETGTWYNLLKNNDPREVTNTTSTIALQPGEFIVFADNPSLALIDPDDLDADGVPNTDDLCADTPFGATVDVNGCEIFSLAVDNFSIKSSSETCRSSNNGSITIAAKENYNYSATLSGTSDATNAFTSATEFSGLSAGDYTLCITIEGQTDYEQCYDLSITEPEDLSVSSKVNTNTGKVSLSLKGGKVYTINLNGESFTTSQNEITLNLEAQTNTIRVSTDYDCQGFYEETIVLANEISVHPNPVTDSLLYLELGNISDPSVNVEIYTLSGRQISTSDHYVNNGQVQIDVSNIPNGLYVLKIHTAQKTYHYKIVK
ncbi:T9SS type A sorting domain-containing protein [Maribacter sp. ANRC-HE7]|uniref:T9SS type A sorting domain-containing protein n=1 Tax=Maribacter aquimaris TaxID=2737171 RepID=A0ABR7UYJ1_9FLAO|nr:alpha-amylase family glycosyl hydrolase [Maribacter aquimaris]MBD0777130.1 T9SS type A sorting domain-containing protein [Maribacter aquimaris]